MAGRLEGKTCLVTGAAQGIGRAIAEAFLAEGALVVAADLQADTIAKAARIEAMHLDVTDAEGVSAIALHHPRIDVLVNCAGYVATGNALECSVDRFAASLKINVESIFLLTKAVLPGMVARRNGVIINIASVVSTTMAARGRFAYAASKGAVLAMTRSIALDFIQDGIRCNSISPGTVDTPSLASRINAANDPEAARRDLVGRQPLGRLGRAEEVAAVAVLLASGECDFMTGADIVVDGGMSL